MNNILFIEITAREAVTDNVIKEDSYFALNYLYSDVFAVDLESGKVTSVREACLDAGLHQVVERTMYFDIKYGLFYSNAGIVTEREETFLMQMQDGVFRLQKVSETWLGLYIQDKYKNVYLIDTEATDPNDYDLNLVRLLTLDGKTYDYFESTEHEIFRALRSDRDRNGNYNTVESLQADGHWAKETSSSDKVLRNQLSYSDAFQGGEWMLKEGKILRIADYAGGIITCYNVDGILIAHLKNDSEEVIFTFSDEEQVTPDFQCLDFYTDGYADYERIVSFETDSHEFKYWISVNDSAHILKIYNEDYSFRQYKMTAEDGKIRLTEIKPMYNGVEISEEITFLE